MILFRTRVTIRLISKSVMLIFSKLLKCQLRFFFSYRFSMSSKKLFFSENFNFFSSKKSMRIFIYSLYSPDLAIIFILEFFFNINFFV